MRLRTQRARILFVIAVLPPLIAQAFITGCWLGWETERHQGLWHVTWTVWAFIFGVGAVVAAMLGVVLAIGAWVNRGDSR